MAKISTMIRPAGQKPARKATRAKILEAAKSVFSDLCEHTCKGFSHTEATETTIEQTRQRRNATVSVFRTVSLLDTGYPPLDICLDHKVIHQRSKEIGKQNSQHDTFGKSWIDNTN